jgi:LuxR family maltose regulon positive regulatory protein
MSQHWRGVPKVGSPRFSWRRSRCRGETIFAGFAGDDRYIVDYLAEEVLQRQSAHVRHFLLQTSILDRLSGPLCDAVTGHDGAKAKLAALEQGNLFLVPLDNRRRWYRYHLFADVLRAHLLDEQPDIVSELHRRGEHLIRAKRRAGRGDRPCAGSSGLPAGGGPDRTGDFSAAPDRREARLRRWLKVIPMSWSA